jgi:signal transduction histidine kinase/CheY-like chemotaxis protein
MQEGNRDMLAVLRDISEWDAATASLRESQKINKTGTWRFDLTTGEVWWSSELFRIFELPVAPAAPPYETHGALFTPESWQRLEPAVAAASEKGTPYELELELARRDGRRRFAVARCGPQFDETGKIVRLVGTFQDVTELALSQVEKDKLLDRLSLAKSAAGFGIWEWNPETGELTWDERMYELYGVDEPVLCYAGWRDRVHPEDVAEAEAGLQKAAAGEGEFKSNFRINRNGDVRHIYSVASMSNERMIGVNLDVTDQVRMREESRRMNNLESLGVLAGGIAHDFNNQLARISAESELLALRSTEPGYVAGAVGRLQLAVEKATSLTRQLLTFAKGGAPVRRSASIEDLVRENVEFARRGTPLGVEYEFAADLANIDVDYHQIGQVVQNIVINAAQAVGDSGGAIRVSARNVPSGSGRGPDAEFVELLIEDNGPGIPEHLLSRVFDPYFTTRKGGHGLGLAICHSIVQQHGGQISVTSEVETGTRFRVLLPATSRPVSEPLQAVQARGGDGRVLVVDDMPPVLEATERMVSALGYGSETASSVSAATARYQEAIDTGKPFDVVITDLTMPGSGGGVELLQKIRALDPAARVVVASGYADDASFSQAEHLGFVGRLSKPFKLVDLDRCLRKALGR